MCHSAYTNVNNEVWLEREGLEEVDLRVHVHSACRGGAVGIVEQRGEAVEYEALMRHPGFHLLLKHLQHERRVEQLPFQ